MDNRSYDRPLYHLPEKFGLVDTIGRKPRCEVGAFLFGQPSFHNAAAVGRVVFLSHGVTSFRRRTWGPRASPAKRVAWGEDERGMNELSH